MFEPRPLRLPLHDKLKRNRRHNTKHKRRRRKKRNNTPNNNYINSFSHFFRCMRVCLALFTCTKYYAVLLLELLPLLLFKQYSLLFSHLARLLWLIYCLFISPIDHTHTLIQAQKIYSVRSTYIGTGISVNNKATLIHTHQHHLHTRLHKYTHAPEEFVYVFCFGFICHSQLIVCVYLFIHEYTVHVTCTGTGTHTCAQCSSE